jgi:hypothetical protein
VEDVGLCAESVETNSAALVTVLAAPNGTAEERVYLFCFCLKWLGSAELRVLLTALYRVTLGTNSSKDPVSQADC